MKLQAKIVQLLLVSLLLARDWSAADDVPNLETAD